MLMNKQAHLRMIRSQCISASFAQPFLIAGRFVKGMTSAVGSNNASLTICLCTLQDEEGALAVCLQTGDGGNDGSPYYEDPNVLGRRYVSPYIHLSPDLAFVLKNTENQVCGYVLATLHSDRFYERYVTEWLPKMRQLYPVTPGGTIADSIFLLV
jgi:hypothetical protein